MSEEHLLAMVRAPEKCEYLKRIFDPILDARCDIMTIGEHMFDLQYYLGADMKFINEVKGIGACNSTYSCAWCKCPSSERHDSTKKWSMVDPVKGARTISEIQRMSKLKKGKNASCLREPFSLHSSSSCNPRPLASFPQNFRSINNSFDSDIEACR